MWNYVESLTLALGQHQLESSETALDLNQALAENSASVGGSTVGVVPERCCIGHT